MRVKIFIFHKWRRQSAFICLNVGAPLNQEINNCVIIIIIIISPHRAGLVWRSLKEVHWAHFSVMYSSKRGNFKKKRKEINARKYFFLLFLVFQQTHSHRLKLWRARSWSYRRCLKSTGPFFIFIYHSCLLLSSPKLILFSFFVVVVVVVKTDGSTSQETPPEQLRAGKTCSSFSSYYDLPLNSFTPADHHHHAANDEWRPIKRLGEEAEEERKKEEKQRTWRGWN